MQNQSDNPALSNKVMDRLGSIESSSSATIAGTSIKVFLFLLLCVLGAYFGWQAMASGSSSAFIAIAAATIIAFVAAIITAFKPTLAMFTGTIYSLAQGYVMGAISQIYNAQLDGIVIQAISLTGAIFFVSLWAFSLGFIKVTEKFRVGVIIATLGIGLYYLIALILGFFGVNVPLIYDSGPWGIAFSLFVVFMATLNLILDFDFIKRAESQQMPKVFEWYGAFALMVTLVWLYIEVLRLLGKVRS